ncbi:hypothetical protein WICPIJ_004536 [Wickerhamomyces pijperi]|uniref:Uncharacterized protein n=1 Tax=Wickerhamomyces pijperi TaxID=599730 RepID=A0A9P8TN67_WICPI|nr:hypothetical protein WICPIJ_004536 [Wickerhamomyces pijperi]
MWFIREETILKTAIFNGDIRLENVLTHLDNVIFYDMRPPLLTKLISMQEDQRKPGRLRFSGIGLVSVIVSLGSTGRYWTELLEWEVESV